MLTYMFFFLYPRIYRRNTNSAYMTNSPGREESLSVFRSIQFSNPANRPPAPSEPSPKKQNNKNKKKKKSGHVLAIYLLTRGSRLQYPQSSRTHLRTDYLPRYHMRKCKRLSAGGYKYTHKYRTVKPHAPGGDLSSIFPSQARFFFFSEKKSARSCFFFFFFCHKRLYAK